LYRGEHAAATRIANHRVKKRFIGKNLSLSNPLIAFVRGL
jgi:hypothetical protein